MSYHPRGYVKTILDTMATKSDDREWSTSELVAIVGMTESSLSSTMRTAVRHGLLHKERRGRFTVYKLTPFEVEQSEPMPFRAAAWDDGDIDLYGLIELEDGGYRVSAENAPKLRRLLGAPA